MSHERTWVAHRSLLIADCSPDLLRNSVSLTPYLSCNLSTGLLTMDLKHISRGITEGRDRAGARSMFKAVGYSDADLSRPLIGVANTWIETMPCNFHLRRLSAKVKEGIRAAGGTPMEFNTIAISDGETMGTEGMKASLVSREIIADSIELVCR